MANWFDKAFLRVKILSILLVASLVADDVLLLLMGLRFAVSKHIKYKLNELNVNNNFLMDISPVNKFASAERK